MRLELLAEMYHNTHICMTGTQKQNRPLTRVNLKIKILGTNSKAPPAPVVVESRMTVWLHLMTLTR